jgi:hypothetical protein
VREREREGESDEGWGFREKGRERERERDRESLPLGNEFVLTLFTEPEAVVSKVYERGILKVISLPDVAILVTQAPVLSVEPERE